MLAARVGAFGKLSSSAELGGSPLSVSRIFVRRFAVTRIEATSRVAAVAPTSTRRL
jgi:hypothetical protein